MPKHRSKGKPRAPQVDSRDELPNSNPAMEKYYAAQNLFQDPAELEQMFDKFRSPLPMTFRITAGRQTAKDLEDVMRSQYVPFLSNITFEGEQLSPPTILPWYPQGLAYQLNVPKYHVRKSPEFKRFQQFLVYETEAGNISRQEAVSMIPPLLLDVKPHHQVLDCCAAPGSKTAQLIEALHTAPSNEAQADFKPSGLLIANDSDPKRAQMLVHQTLNRIGSPNVMVTQLDASIIPNLRIEGEGGMLTHLEFDRILCDVPCSGDGTMRKNPMIWKSWTAAVGMGLHSLQLRILSRALHLLKPGGRLVYSTCSLNPLENEAVVSAALQKFENVHLLDMGHELPSLKRSPGLTKWNVIDKDGDNIDVASLDAEEHSKSKGKPISRTCWPCGREAEFGLERCMRLYPHQQDTGGFFVAVLEKKAVATVDAVDDGQRPSKKVKVETKTAAEETQVPDSSFKEDPYSYLSSGDSQVQCCVDFFGLRADFPRQNLLVRNAEGVAHRSIYVTSDKVRSIVLNNAYSRMRLVSCGVKVFQRQDPGKDGVYACKWRLLQEGIDTMLPYVGERRRIRGDVSSLRELLSGELNPALDSLKNEELQSRVRDVECGSFVCEFGSEQGNTRHRLTLPMWRAPHSVSLMLAKHDKAALLKRFDDEESVVG